MKKLNEHIKCFEDIENVFHEKHKNYDLIFFPLCSINLKNIIPNRDEWIHFVDVWNNGDIEDSYFNEYRTRDSIKFKLESSKYHYVGDEKAFPKYEYLKNWKDESKNEFEKNKEEYIKIVEPKEFQESNRKLIENKRQEKEFDHFLYTDQLITYLVTKERFTREGKIVNYKSFPNGYEIKPKNPIKQLGGTPQWDQSNMTPKNKDGKPYTFIGEVIGFNYMKNGSDRILLFLDEETNDAIEIIQFG